MNFLKIPNKKGDKINFYYDFGRGKGKRPSTGIYIFKCPINEIQKNHNKEALLLLEVKRSQAMLEQQSIGTPFIPKHKYKANFLEFYEEYVNNHRSAENRHLPCSFIKFKTFIGKDFISPVEITEEFCKRFRSYLLDHLTGETPQNYFARFKWVVKAATKAKYFIDNPVENVSAKANPSIELKEIVEAEDYFSLMATPCHNEEIGHAFIFCLYTGLRWVDVSQMKWQDLKENSLTTRIIQSKTGRPVVITLHPIALRILDKQKLKQARSKKIIEKVFALPTPDGANKILGLWTREAGLKKKITWSCARLSFSVLLQDKNVDSATVAYLLGHTTTKQVSRIYKRHRPKDQQETINNLPSPENQTAINIASTEKSGNNWTYIIGTGKDSVNFS